MTPLEELRDAACVVLDNADERAKLTPAALDTLKDLVVRLSLSGEWAECDEDGES